MIFPKGQGVSSPGTSQPFVKRLRDTTCLADAIDAPAIRRPTNERQTGRRVRCHSAVVALIGFRSAGDRSAGLANTSRTPAPSTPTSRRAWANQLASAPPPSPSSPTTPSSSASTERSATSPPSPPPTSSASAFLGGSGQPPASPSSGIIQAFGNLGAVDAATTTNRPAYSSPPWTPT